MKSFDRETPANGGLRREAIPISGWKRALDITLIVVALPVIVPLMLLVAGLIRLTSAGPVLFKQERVGYLGHPFLCLKFRTMFVGVDTTVHQGYLSRLMDSNEPMEKLDARGDVRVIPLGRLLRSSGLDELPQIFNVLRGEMSLVGPRPCMAYEYDRYLPWQLERFNAAPGLTGLWQVNGKNRTTFAQMIRMDIQYVRNPSLALDLWIIIKTVPALIVQIQEARKRRRMLALPADPKSILSAPAGNQ